MTFHIAFNWYAHFVKSTARNLCKLSMDISHICWNDQFSGMTFLVLCSRKTGKGHVNKNFHQIIFQKSSPVTKSIPELQTDVSSNSPKFFVPKAWHCSHLLYLKPWYFMIFWHSKILLECSLSTILMWTGRAHPVSAFDSIDSIPFCFSVEP